MERPDERGNTRFRSFLVVIACASITFATCILSSQLKPKSDMGVLLKRGTSSEISSLLIRSAQIEKANQPFIIFVWQGCAECSLLQPSVLKTLSPAYSKFIVLSNDLLVADSCKDAGLAHSNLIAKSDILPQLPDPSFYVVSGSKLIYEESDLSSQLSFQERYANALKASRSN